jgi:hypothetical protein
MKWQQTTTLLSLLLWNGFLVAKNDAFCCNPNTPSLPMSKRFPATNARTTSRPALHEMKQSDNNNSIGKSPLSGVAPKSSTVDVVVAAVEPPTATTPKRLDRRSALNSVSVSLMCSLLGGSGLVVAATTAQPETADAFDKTFPMELTESDAPKELVDESISLTNKRYSQGSRSNSAQRAVEAAAMVQRNQQNVANFNVRNDLVPSLIWGGALWLLSGSRSNPLATPLANVLYDERKEAWLQDRNAGLFADFPLPLYLVLALVFVCLGVSTQFGLLQLLQGDADVTLQWAEVTFLFGGFIELGRIASGEKLETRVENNRTVQLQQEFEQFATARLDARSGGNCHRSDVVAAFRRYYGKYRQADNEQYPLTDLEVEKLLRAWNQGPNRGRAEMTSAGFYYGISINKDADVFVQK